MTACLDTNVAVWLAQSSSERISARAQKAIEAANNLLLSPIVLIELGYLYEAGRILISATELKLKLEHEIAMRMCNLDFVCRSNGAP